MSATASSSTSKGPAPKKQKIVVEHVEEEEQEPGPVVPSTKHYVKIDFENEPMVVTLHFRSSGQLVEDYPDVIPEQWWEFPKVDEEGNPHVDFTAEDIGEWTCEDLGIPLDQQPLIIDVYQELARIPDPIEMCFLWEAVADGNDPVKPIPDLTAYPDLQNAVNALLAPGTGFVWR